MSIIAELEGGAQCVVPVDPDQRVAALVSDIHEALGLPLAPDAYDMVLEGAGYGGGGDVFALTNEDPPASEGWGAASTSPTTLADVGIVGHEEHVSVRVKFMHIARERLRAAGVTTASGACGAIAAATRGEVEGGDRAVALERVRLVAASLLLSDGELDAEMVRAAARGGAEVLEILLEATGTRAEAQKRHALYGAVSGGHLDAVRVVLRRLTLTPSVGFHALRRAAEAGDIVIMKVLLASGARVMIETGGRTPLACAARAGSAEAVALLLDHDAPVDMSDCPPLVYAARGGHTACVELLLDAGADPDYADDDERTALWWAAARGFPRVVAALLTHGANATLADSDNLSPAALAAREGHVDIARLCEGAAA